jgi:hypothetical protein
MPPVHERKKPGRLGNNHIQPFEFRRQAWLCQKKPVKLIHFPSHSSACRNRHPVLAGLLLEINALILFVMGVGLVAHEATSLWDPHYAHSKRDIAPIEQHVHSFQEIIPIVLFALVCVLHWEQFVALLAWSDTARFSLEWKQDPLPAAYLAAVLSASLLFVELPFIEEFVRTARRAGACSE